MASFRQHSSFSALVGTALFPIGLFYFGMNIPDALLAALWCWFAGILPDVDCNTGRPIELIFNQLAGCLPLLVIVQLPQETPRSTLTLVFVAAYFFIKYPVRKLFEICSVHRGAFHSIPMGLLIASLVTLAYRSEGPIAWIIGGGVFAGYLSHLVLDEIFSVDLLRVRIKKSFGTALTLSAGSLGKNLLLYFLLGLSLLAVWLTTA